MFIITTPSLKDPQHVHREMLKTLCLLLQRRTVREYLIRGFMENDADDFELLYNRDSEAARIIGSFTNTAFGSRNLSFMSQVKLPDGTLQELSDAGVRDCWRRGKREGGGRAVVRQLQRSYESLRWRYVEEFADIYRKYSQTPYTPEPGYVLSVGLAGSPSSTGTTVSASSFD